MLLFLRRANASKLCLFLALVLIFIIILYCNHLTPLSGDDYCYMFSFADGSRIQQISDIFPSMNAHWHTTNGRVIPHFFVQLFLMYPKTIFNIVNALIFTLYIFLIYRLAFLFSSFSVQNQNLLLLATVFCVVWLLSQVFGTVFLWLDGSVNYLWCEVIVLLWLIPQVLHYSRGQTMNIGLEVLYALLSLLVGNYAENSSVAAVFLSMVFLALTRFYRREKLRRWQVTSFIAMVLGFLLLAFAPAELLTKIAKPSLGFMVKNFLSVLLSYLKFWPLLAFFALGYVLHRQLELDRDTRVLCLAFVAASLAAQFVLTFALYLSERSTHIAMLYLLLACAVLYRPLFETKLQPALCLVSTICLCFTLYWGYVAVDDLRVTHYRYTYNEELIQDMIRSGEAKLHIPYIIPNTPYSDFYVWQYIRQDPNHYINQTMSKYYGVEEISGYFFYLD
ncbi:MAG: hypothetical protein IJV41_12555 [Oscillospiraceae bacterium]|nr:hypothetical protein [Oscillospiraceae bacterium]